MRADVLSKPRLPRIKTPLVSWSTTEVAVLIRLKMEGWTGAEIARELGRTRNSIIGKLNRMGVTEISLQEDRERLAAANAQMIPFPVIPKPPEIVAGKCPHVAQWQPRRTKCASCIRQGLPKHERKWTGLGGTGMSSIA